LLCDGATNAAEARAKLAFWRPFFDAVPQDPFMETRYKRVAWFRDGGREQLSNAPLVQPTAFNPVHGDLVRQYAAIPTQLIESAPFRALLAAFAAQFDAPRDDVILAQLQRITCCDAALGHPAIEGYHQDGNRYAAIVCVARENIAGATTRLAHDKHGGASSICYERVLQPGDALFFRDDQVFHYTTPISVNGGRHGFRDVIILSGPAHAQRGKQQ
jgi:histidine decarboxylase